MCFPFLIQVVVRMDVAGDGVRHHPHKGPIHRLLRQERYFVVVFDDGGGRDGF